ncbi:hypothetical protein [Pseudomonas idahonensis]|nr:hypothetical protein [Pseudomonas idahonensis]
MRTRLPEELEDVTGISAEGLAQQLRNVVLAPKRHGGELQRH